MRKGPRAAAVILSVVVVGLLGFAAPARAQQYRTGIGVERSCPATASVGQTITITIRVFNTGDEPLKGVKVLDTLLGDLGASYPDNMDVGGSETRSFSHVVSADDPDPLVGSVEALTEGAITDESEDATASCQTDIVPTEVLGTGPHVDVTKTCAPSAAVGSDVVYTIRIHNSGSEALSAITVGDSMFGDLSSTFADTLGAGASEEHTFVHHVGASDPDPLTNTVTVEATGATAQVVDSASCTTDVLAAAVLGREFLPASGSDVALIAWVGFAFMAAGAAILAASPSARRS